MTKRLIFYTNPMSRGRPVRWMLEELGVPYETRIVQFGPEMKSADYKAVNPMGKVPAIKHGDLIVTEVAAILAYLADAFPAAGLAPSTDDPARGSYYRWMFFAAGPMEYAISNRSFGFKLDSPQERGRMGYGCYEDVVETLDKALTGTEFVAGGKFSAADLHLSSFLAFAMMVGGIDKRPSFEAYAGRHKARPAAIRAAAIDDELAAKQG